MLNILCEKCEGNAYLNDNLTSQDYMENMETLVIDNGKVTDDRPNYFYYTCYNCDSTHKLTIEEVLIKLRDMFVIKALKTRYESAFDSFRGYNISEDSGLLYCGQCPGIDGSGNCFKDAYNICKMRRV